MRHFEAIPTASSARQAANTGTAGLSVLIVDDDADHRGGVRDLLEDCGYTVAEAANGKEALQYVFERPADKPCVVLLDLSMPVMSGAEFLTILRKYLRLASIPVIVISGNQPLLGPVVHGGIAGLLSKPYRGDELLALIRKHTATPPRAVKTYDDAE